MTTLTGLRRELRTHEDGLSRILDAINDGVLAIDREGRLTFINSAAQSILGLSANGPIGGQNVRPLEPLGAGGELALVERLPYAEVVQTGLPVSEAERAIEGSDGSRVVLCVSAVPLFDDRGQVATVVLSVKDVTERKRSEEEADRLAAIVEFSDDAIVSRSMDGIILSWNKGAERMYGYSRGEVLGKNLSVLFPPDRPEELPTINEKLRRGERIDHFETQRVRKDGSLIVVSVSVSPIKDQNGRVIGASSITRDISERKLMERLRDEYVSLISHDLRSPLTAVMGRAELLRRELDRKGLAREAESARAIAVCAEHMNSMIQDLVDSARLEAGQLKMRKQRVDLPELVRDVVARIGSIKEQARLQVDCVAQGVFVMADPGRIERALTNLISNALKYSPEDAPVVVRVSQEGERAVIHVVDWGVGIPSEEKPHVFERFYRARTSRKADGVGLGLYITRMIVEAHGGCIWVESELGKGSTFGVSLPAAQ